MQSERKMKPDSAASTAVMPPSEIEILLSKLERENLYLRRQVAWFQRQIFGQKSERRLPEPDGVQGSLGETFDAIPEATPAGKKTRIAAHERESKLKRDAGHADESTLFFDDQKVPVETIAVANPEVAGLASEDYEVIGEKVTHRLAQRPGSYVILKYVRQVIKRLDTQALSCPAAPVGVIDGTPIKAGPAGAGKMKAAYFWPVYGEQDEICFLYYPSRSARHVQEALGLSPPAGAVLQTDGYAAYAQYAKRTGLTHAQCWAHARKR